MSRECNHPYAERVIWVSSHHWDDIAEAAKGRGAMFAAWVCDRSACVAEAEERCYQVTRRLPILERRGGAA